MKILVLGGCGAMGSETTRDLVQTSDFEKIMVADADLAKAQAYCDTLNDKRLAAMAVDVTDKNKLIELFAGYDVIANCTPYKFGLIITEAAIAAKRNILDLGGLYNTPKQLAMDAQAKEAGIVVLLGCGATPGVTNLMASAAAEQLDEVDEVQISFATFRSLAPSPGLLDTVLDEFSPGTVRFYYEQGKFIEVPPFAGETAVDFMPPVGRQNVYFVPHSETHTLPRFLFGGVNKVTVRGCWRPETMAALKHYNDVGLLKTDPIKVEGINLAPKAFLRSFFLANHDTNDQGEWAFYLNVQIFGSTDGARAHITYNLDHPRRSEWGQTCTAKVTGIPASIGAQMLAKGAVKRHGVVACEACFEPVPFFKELTKRGIHIHERVVTERKWVSPKEAVASEVGGQ